MINHAYRVAEVGDPPALTRLAALVSLDSAAHAALQAAMAASERYAARREVLHDGKPVARPLILTSGWAARVRILPDGRRQFMSFILPGEMIGNCRQPCPVASSTVAALTDATVCTAPSRDEYPALGEAYDISAALEEAHLLAQITRLGRMNAQERIEDLFLELHERLTLSGIAVPNGFAMPLTQEMLADALGLTAVHVNRMVQTMRRDSGFLWKTGRIVLSDPKMLARKVGRAPTRVSAG